MVSETLTAALLSRGSLVVWASTMSICLMIGSIAAVALSVSEESARFSSGPQLYIWCIAAQQAAGNVSIWLYIVYILIHCDAMVTISQRWRCLRNSLPFESLGTIGGGVIITFSLLRILHFGLHYWRARWQFANIPCGSLTIVFCMVQEFVVVWFLAVMGVSYYFCRYRVYLWNKKLHLLIYIAMTSRSKTTNFCLLAVFGCIWFIDLLYRACNNSTHAITAAILTENYIFLKVRRDASPALDLSSYLASSENSEPLNKSEHTRVPSLTQLSEGDGDILGASNPDGLSRESFGAKARGMSARIGLSMNHWRSKLFDCYEGTCVNMRVTSISHLNSHPFTVRDWDDNFLYFAIKVREKGWTWELWAMLAVISRDVRHVMIRSDPSKGTVFERLRAGKLGRFQTEPVRRASHSTYFDRPLTLPRPGRCVIHPGSLMSPVGSHRVSFSSSLDWGYADGNVEDSFEGDAAREGRDHEGFRSFVSKPSQFTILSARDEWAKPRSKSCKRGKDHRAVAFSTELLGVARHYTAGPKMSIPLPLIRSETVDLSFCAGERGCQRGQRRPSANPVMGDPGLLVSPDRMPHRDYQRVSVVSTARSAVVSRGDDDARSEDDILSAQWVSDDDHTMFDSHESGFGGARPHPSHFAINDPELLSRQGTRRKAIQGTLQSDASCSTSQHTQLPHSIDFEKLPSRPDREASPAEKHSPSVCAKYITEEDIARGLEALHPTPSMVDWRSTFSQLCSAVISFAYRSTSGERGGHSLASHLPRQGPPESFILSSPSLEQHMESQLTSSFSDPAAQMSLTRIHRCPPLKTMRSIRNWNQRITLSCPLYTKRPSHDGSRHRIILCSDYGIYKSLLRIEEAFEHWTNDPRTQLMRDTADLLGQKLRQSSGNTSKTPQLKLGYSHRVKYDSLLSTFYKFFNGLFNVVVLLLMPLSLMRLETDDDKWMVAILIACQLLCIIAEVGRLSECWIVTQRPTLGRTIFACVDASSIILTAILIVINYSGTDSFDSSELGEAYLGGLLGLAKIEYSCDRSLNCGIEWRGTRNSASIMYGFMVCNLHRAVRNLSSAYWLKSDAILRSGIISECCASTTIDCIWTLSEHKPKLLRHVHRKLMAMAVKYSKSAPRPLSPNAVTFLRSAETESPTGDSSSNVGCLFLGRHNSQLISPISADKQHSPPLCAIPGHDFTFKVLVPTHLKYEIAWYQLPAFEVVTGDNHAVLKSCLQRRSASLNRGAKIRMELGEDHRTCKDVADCYQDLRDYVKIISRNRGELVVAPT